MPASRNSKNWNAIGRLEAWIGCDQQRTDLGRATVRLDAPDQAKQAVDRLLQEANLNAYGKVRPGEAPERQLIRVPRSDVERLQSIIRKPETWVISLRSATNVLRGEQRCMPSQKCVRTGR